MASTTHLSVMEDEFREVNGGFDHLVIHHRHPSRLSACRSSVTCVNEDEDADEELSGAFVPDKDQDCYPLQATPPWRRLLRCGETEKDYVSENETRKGSRKNARRSRVARGFGGRKMEEQRSGNSNYWAGVSEGEGCGGAVPVVVITRPKGGQKSLCMDLEEVKACHDLGFELEHQRMLEVLPRPITPTSGQNLDLSSSGGNSPISSWRISSPGDDPREVKARLKVWAQAVALVSASQSHCCSN